MVKQLQYEVFQYRSHTIADSTKGTYKTHLNCYIKFCLFMGFPSVPATTFNICLYAAFLGRSLKASSVRQYIGIIGTLHKEFGLKNPLIDNYFVSSLLKGINHVKGDSHIQKLPMTIDILSRIYNILNFRSSFDSSFWAICLTAFFGMFRKSHLLSTSAGKFSSVQQFCKSDFQFFDWGVLIHVKWSKTIQFRDRKVCISFSYIPNSHLCPVKAILHAFSFTGSSSDSAQAFAFLDVASGRISTFTYPHFYLICALAFGTLALIPSFMQATLFVVVELALHMKQDYLLT